MRSTRRAFVVALAAAGGGCLGIGNDPTPTARPDSDDDGIPDDVDDYPTDDRRGLRSSSTEATESTIEAGEFRAYGLTNSPQDSGEYVEYDVTVEGEGAVDCLVFRREAYDAYEEGDRDAAVVDELSRTGVSETNVVEQLPEGEFIFVLDYTAQATDPERERVTVSYSVEIADPVSTAITD
ncbi:twin-arginine translocation signal domain-containing protein [Halosimplex sp. J119]